MGLFHLGLFYLGLFCMGLFYFGTIFSGTILFGTILFWDYFFPGLFYLGLFCLGLFCLGLFFSGTILGRAILGGSILAGAILVPSHIYCPPKRKVCTKSPLNDLCTRVWLPTKSNQNVHCDILLFVNRTSTRQRNIWRRAISGILTRLGWFDPLMGRVDQPK